MNGRATQLLLVACLVACGNGGGASHDVAKAPWHFIRFVDAPKNQLAIVANDRQTAVLDANGVIKETILAARTDSGVFAAGNGEVIVVDADALHALDVAGRQLWTRSVPPGARAVGASTLALASPTQSSLLDLKSGKAVAEFGGASRAVRAGDGFVFILDEEFRFVDELGKERWRRKVERSSNAALLAQPDVLQVIRPDHSYEELEYATGTTRTKGECTPKPNEADEAERGQNPPLPCVGGIATGAREQVVLIPPRATTKGDYTLFVKRGVTGGDQTQLVARDVIGRVRWKSSWPTATASVMERARMSDSSKLVGFVVGGAQDARSFVVFDDDGGSRLFDHPLVGKERVAGATESCWLLVSDAALHCISARTGVEKWAVQLSGARTDAWPLDGGDVLVVDGSPLVLSRIADGKRKWQLELPDTDLDRGDALDSIGALTHSTSTGHEYWSFSDALGITTGVVPSSKLLVIDLTQGKLKEVH